MSISSLRLRNIFVGVVDVNESTERNFSSILKKDCNYLIILYNIIYYKWGMIGRIIAHLFSKKDFTHLLRCVIIRFYIYIN